MAGSNQLSASGTYGTLGVRASTNSPGARCNSSSCTGAQGELWLFGGSGAGAGGAIGYLNDLWKFDGAQWTWMSGSSSPWASGTYGVQGSASPANVPGARVGTILVSDPSGDVWLFGGTSFSAGNQLVDFDDLWKFDGTQWTWIAGSSTPGAAPTYQVQGVASGSNTPGARFGMARWIDQGGALWVFGGQSIAADGSQPTLGDLWKYDSRGWTWVSGSSSPNQPGVYGTQGVAGPQTLPGARSGATATLDSSGNVWLFGGLGFGSTGTGPLWLNDLWKFDGTVWTWASGSDVVASVAEYGTPGVASPGNTPGARSGSALWPDGSGGLWLFGGFGYGNVAGSQVQPGKGFFGNMNDLWRFDGTLWAWVGGSNYAEQQGLYGTLGVPSTQNIPGGRIPAGFSKDASGNLWVFGGISWDSSGQNGLMNDLWRYSP
jgi:N-acetylneuraminic acid mutarotase